MSFASIDLFSSQFSYNIRGNSIQKGTNRGSFFTIIVLCITIAYLIYVFVQYFNNEIEPTYRAQALSINFTQLIDIVKNLFAYRIDYPDAQTNLVYSSVKILANYKNTTSIASLQIPTKQCLDPNLDGYLCFDLDQFYQQSANLNILDQKYNYELAQLSFLTQSSNDNIQVPQNGAS
ncbi:hypothetical protein ABPG72_016033 [Tetrahymena utriculariae]